MVSRPWDTDRAARDRAYAPGSCVSDMSDHVRRYAERSTLARADLTWRELRYGRGPAERLDFFPAHQQGDAGLLVFVHGGQWQPPGKSDAAFLAPDLVSRGVAFAALGYGLAPTHRLDDIVQMVRRGVLWLYLRAAALGVDRERIVLSGSGAGAHLVAMCLLDGWLPSHLRPADVLRAAVLLSGIYELEPLRDSHVGEAIGLSRDQAARNSPIRHLPTELPPVVVARGGTESAAFVDQHDLFVAALTVRGTPLADLVVRSRNHFDLPFDLADPNTALGRATLAHLETPSFLKALPG